MRRLTILALGLALAATAWAADWVDNDIDVTATSQTLTLDATGNGYRAFWYINDGANEVFVCPWRKGETVIACTDAIGRKLLPATSPGLAGEAKTWTVPDAGTNPSRKGFTHVTVICSAGETSDDNRAEAFAPYSN